VSFAGHLLRPRITLKRQKKDRDQLPEASRWFVNYNLWPRKNIWRPPWGRRVLHRSKTTIQENKMVSTRSRTADVPPVVPTVEAGDPGPASEISRILEAQARMQQEFAEYKKRNADEMEALREENSRLRQKIEADQAAGEPYQPRSRADVPPNSRVTAPPHSRVDIHPTEDESEYRPTGPTTGGNYSSFASKRNRRHPFIDGITETPLPHKWKAPTVTYDGTTDPDEFVSIYTNQVGLYSTDDAVLCKSFSVALRGSALEWFMSLPPYTIDSFTTLTTTFTTQFDTSRRHDLTTIALLNLRQEEGEPLRVFIDRFGTIAMKIKDLTPNLILMYMMTSLRPGPFADELAMSPPNVNRTARWSEDPLSSPTTLP